MRIAFAYALIVLWGQCFVTSNLEAQDSVRGYFIGNSLSWDMLKSGGLEQVASSVGDQQVLASQHIQCNTPLSGIIDSWVTDPNGNPVCTISASSAGRDYDLGIYDGSFDDIDFLVLQPFQNATLREEIAATKTIIDQFRANPANQDSRVLIYQTWDLRRDAAGYLQDWRNRKVGLDDEFRPSQDAYQKLFADLTNSGYEYEVIPVGQAFADASVELSNGGIGNIETTSELFRDFIHGSNAGRYLADLVASRVITEQTVLNVADADNFAAFGLANHDLEANAEASARLRQIAEVTVVGVPEPNSAVLLGVGAVAAVLRRRRGFETPKSDFEDAIVT